MKHNVFLRLSNFFLFACRVSVRPVGGQEGGGNEPRDLLRISSLYQEALGAGDFQGENLEELC
jgi:hypothetical protein